MASRTMIAAVGLLAAACGIPSRADDALPDGAVARLGVARPRWNAQVVAAFPDGQTVITADDGLNVCRWDLATGRILAQRHFPCPDTAWPSLSADGTRLAARLWGGATI